MQELAIFLAAVTTGAALGSAVLRFAAPGLLGRLASAPAAPAPEIPSAGHVTRKRVRRPAPEALPDPPEPAAEIGPLPAPCPAETQSPSPPEPESAAEPAPAEEPEEPQRRQHERLISTEPILVTPFGGSETMAEVCDVSLGGVRFRVMGMSLRTDDIVRVTFNVDGESLCAVARVLRVEPLDDITIEVAAVFARLDPWAARRFEAALAKEA